jgi:hypothetical protein
MGLGAMISELGGNEESVEAFKAAINKMIASIHVREDAVDLGLADGSRVQLYDDGQSCCEYRYLRSDDDLGHHVGATLLGAEVEAAAETTAGDDGDHEIAFLKIKTSRGVFTVAAHNEHNGYYGGISIRARVVQAEPARTERKTGPQENP